MLFVLFVQQLLSTPHCAAFCPFFSSPCDILHHFLLQLSRVTAILEVAIIPGATSAAPLDENENVEELIPMVASSCRYNHYEVTSTWPNGNVQTVTYWVVDAQGNQIGTNTWTSSYPASGDGSMGPAGTPGGFAGCKCPNWR